MSEPTVSVPVVEPIVPKVPKPGGAMLVRADSVSVSWGFVIGTAAAAVVVIAILYYMNMRKAAAK